MIPIQQLPKLPTRKCFEEAFLELYAQKPLDQISVMALTEKAGYSRATFYRNYYSISNVLESVEEENTCTSTCQAIISCLDDITLEQATDAMADFYQKRFREVSILANGEYGSIYLDKRCEPMKQLFAALLDRGFELSSFQLDVISEYIASAKVGMLAGQHLTAPFLTSSVAVPNSPLRRCCRSLRTGESVTGSSAAVVVGMIGMRSSVIEKARFALILMRTCCGYRSAAICNPEAVRENVVARLNG